MRVCGGGGARVGRPTGKGVLSVQLREPAEQFNYNLNNS